MTTQKPTVPKTTTVETNLRPAEDRADRARPSYLDKFKKFEDLERNVSGTLRIKNLPKDLHAHLATATPRNVAKRLEEGYIPYEDIQSDLGECVDGNHVGEAGTQVKWFVCAEEARQLRNKEVTDRNKRIDGVLYRDDEELPQAMHRDTPPPGYIP